MADNTPIHSLILITEIYPELVAWVMAISFFMSIAFTAVISPGRKWYELAVIMQIGCVVSLALVWLIVQWVAGVSLINFETIQRIDAGF